MPSHPFESFTSTYVVLPVDNIDTDQIIPARFLKTTERTGLGGALFHDWRHNPDGSPNASFPLNRIAAREARVLVAGRNFGCGSSREHAVWALLGFGFRAVVSSAFADIFRGNALANGLLPIQVDAATVDRLVMAARDKSPEVTVKLDSQMLVMPHGEAVSFPISPFAKHCLTHGIDEMDFLLGADGELAAYERSHAPRISTTAMVST